MLAQVHIHAFGTCLQGVSGSESRRGNAKLGLQVGRSAQHHLFDPRLTSVGFMKWEIERKQSVVCDDVTSFAKAE